MTAEQTQSAEPAKASDQPIVHTPGPWHVENYNEPIGQTGDYHGVTLIKPESRQRAFPSWIAEVSESDNQGANARLIAAAPELLEALEESLALNINWSETAEDEHLRHLSEYKRVIEQAREAISKATKVV